jgi:hypothetical protein
VSATHTANILILKIDSLLFTNVSQSDNPCGLRF